MALARATAIDTPSSAFAPSRPLLGVPSSAIIAPSTARWSAAFPVSAAAISPFTFATAFRTPLPPYRRVSPSRSSSASRTPVDAPDGTAARPITPPSSVTSTSTVGFPRESRISLPCTVAIFTKSPNFQISKSIGSPVVELRLDPERLVADRSGERIVVFRDDDDAVVADRVAPAILGLVVADLRAARNEHVAVDDRAADARVPPDADARHQEAGFHQA